jgi:phage replication O-like protein O
MSSPQKENGYTPIANELMEALAKTRIPGEARQVLDVIFRKTYGWGKTEDKISLSQFAKMTGIPKRNVCRAINKLLSMNIIIRKTNPPKAVLKNENDNNPTYRIQKDYERWKSYSKLRTFSKSRTSVLKIENKSFSKMTTTIDTSTKETITKTNIRAREETFNRFWAAYPKKVAKGQAIRTWDKLWVKNKLPEIETIVSAIEKQKQSEKWQEENGRYIKHPSTWLNAMGWLDECEVEIKKPEVIPFEIGCALSILKSAGEPDFVEYCRNKKLNPDEVRQHAAEQF